MSNTKKDANSFIHDSNARNDLKMIRLRMKYGAEGYGLYFMIIEIMRDQNNYKILLDDIEVISENLKPMTINIENFLEFCLSRRVQLFKKNTKYFWSESFLNRMDRFNIARKKMSDGGKRGMKKRYKEDITTLQPPYKEDINIIETKKEKEKDIEITKIKIMSDEILKNINTLSDKHFKEKVNIIERLSDGRTFEDCMKVVNTKWKDKKFVSAGHYNPDTLFKKDKFDKYLNQDQSVGFDDGNGKDANKGPWKETEGYYDDMKQFGGKE